MATRVLTPVSVTYTREAKPSAEFAASARDVLRVQGGTGTRCRVYLRYVVDLADDEALTSLSHQVRADAAVASTQIDAQLTALGNVSKMNWNNAPAVVGSAVSDTDTVSWTHDLVDLAPTGGTIIVRLSTTADLVIRLFGPRARRYGPTLTVETETVPAQPTDVEPSGIVSVAAPFLTWLGRAGVDTVQAAAADVDATWDATDGFASPTWTSAETASDAHELDTAAAGWTGIIAGSSADVSVRYHLPSGWSEWSEPITIERVAKPTVTITNPGATTADPTPPVTWTVTGGTQVAWRVIVTNSDEGQVADSGRTAGTALSWTPPDRGGDPGETFTYEVRVWDDVDRIPSSGDPAYAVDTQESVYTPTASVAGLTSFAVWQDGETPAIVPSWTRASGTPDEVDIAVEGGDFLATLAGTDSGTEKLWTVQPNTALTLAAAAVVNDENSEDLLTTTVQTYVTGLWLVDPDTERGFVLATGTDGAQITLGGNSEVHNALYAAHLIRNTLSLRGLEGSVSGMIANWPGRTLADQKADADWLRERPERLLRLIVGDVNVEVVASDMVALFNQAFSFASRGMEYDVSFNFSAA